MPSPRNARIADRIKTIVAGLLERRIKDPRIGFITITDVRLTGDDQHASVFYTVMGDEAERDGTATALSSATGLIRSEVGKQLGLRHTPTIEFFLDAVPEQAREIEELIARAKQADAEVAARAAEADYAGEPDPYKKNDEDDEA